LLRRPEVHYHQIVQLAQRIEQDRQRETPENDPPPLLPTLAEETAQEVELQVKYESYIRKQEQLVHRTQRLEEMRIPDSTNYQAIPHLRTEARQKLSCTQPRTVGQASRVEGVTPADIAILMIYLEKQRAIKASS
jgi:tRNA uridine 5-carboxymethylaminomethyl modification enzyme